MKINRQTYILDSLLNSKFTGIKIFKGNIIFYL